MNKIKRVAWAAGGTACVAMGVIGLFLPLLPTTPFLLLAAFCYARSSTRFYAWLTTNRWCGEYIRNYREGRGISLRHKVATLALLWLTIGYTAGIAVSRGWVKLLLVGIAVAVTLHVTALKTAPRPAVSLMPDDKPLPPRRPVPLEQPKGKFPT